MDVNRGPSLVRGVAELLQPAIGTLRTARDAELPPVPDHLVRKICPAFAGNDPHQLLFNFLRILLFSQFETA